MRKLALVDPDGHGISCGLILLKSCREGIVKLHVFSSFSPRSPLRLSNRNLVNVLGFFLSRYGVIYLVDISSRVNHKRVIVLDHSVGNGSAYGLNMYLMRRFRVEPDWFLLDWSLAGAVLDQDPTVAPYVSPSLEIILCRYVDPLLKRCRLEIISELSGGRYRRLVEDYGDVGALMKLIFEEKLTPLDIYYRYRHLLDDEVDIRFTALDSIVLVEECLGLGMWWKQCWLACALSGKPVAMGLAYEADLGRLVLLFAVYWRHSHVSAILDKVLMRYFSPDRISGRPGLRKIIPTSRDIAELYNLAYRIDQTFKEELTSNEQYESPSTTTTAST